MTKFQPTQLILKQETDNQQDLSPIRKTMTPAKTSGGSIQAAPRISVSSNIGSIAGAQVPGSQNHVTEHKAAVTLGIIMGTFLGMLNFNSKLFFVIKWLNQTKRFGSTLTLCLFVCFSLLDAILLHEHCRSLLQNMYSSNGFQNPYVARIL